MERRIGTIPMWLAAIIGIVCILAGVAIGVFVPSQQATPNGERSVLCNAHGDCATYRQDWIDASANTKDGDVRHKGETFVIKAQMQNNGQTTWAPDTYYARAIEGPAGAATLAKLDREVPPGKTGIFTAEITIPKDHSFPELHMKFELESPWGRFGEWFSRTVVIATNP